VVCISAARVTSRSTRAALLGAGAGIAFGVSALLTKGFVHFLGEGVFGWIGHWEPYALAVCSIGGLVLSQSAFQTGSLGAALGGEQVMQPLVGVALGVGLLNEDVGTAGLLQRLAIVVAMVAALTTVGTLIVTSATFSGLVGIASAVAGGGVVYLVARLLRAPVGAYSAHHNNEVEIAALYWHFVDLIWILVFTFVYLL